MLSREKVEAVLFKWECCQCKGFGYIVDGVLLLEEDSKIKTTYLYFKVAQQHGTTGQRVERAIRHAFDIVRSCRGDYDVVNHYIGFINCANSPSLSMLTMKIREEALEVQEPKPEKKEENVITGITEGTEWVPEGYELQEFGDFQVEFYKETPLQLSVTKIAEEPENPDPEDPNKPEKPEDTGKEDTNKKDDKKEDTKKEDKKKTYSKDWR